MEREEVYKAINSERDYQDVKWGISKDLNNSPDDWILYLENHLNKAKEAIYESHDMVTFKNEMRKIGGLSVASMELFGVENR